jgi:hypothetical protein
VEQFISIVIFSLPGLLTYFWLQLFGLNPPVKHSSTEMIGLSVLLWIPTSIVTLTIYDGSYILFDKFLVATNVDVSFLGLRIITTVSDLVKMADNILFLLIYVLLTSIFSFVFARIWSINLYRYLLNKVNKIRIKRKLSKLDELSSIWDTFFLKISEESASEEGESMIVELYYLNNPDHKIYGSVINMSRPFEAERAIVLDDPEGWREDNLEFSFKIKKTYLDTKSGMVVNLLDHNIN